jgi:hypothetical protein
VNEFHAGNLLGGSKRPKVLPKEVMVNEIPIDVAPGKVLLRVDAKVVPIYMKSKGGVEVTR